VEAAGPVFGRPASERSSLLNVLREPCLDQRLIGHVPPIRLDLDPFEQGDGQAQGDGLRRWLEVRKADLMGRIPVNVLAGIVALPERSLVRLRLELRSGFPMLGHG